MTDHQRFYVREVSELFPPQGLWTEADYLRLPHNPRVVELYSGRLIIHQPKPPDHQRIAGDLAFALDQFVDRAKLGEVLFAPIAVRLRLNQLRMPDVVFIARQHRDRKRKHWIEGPPDWVAEVISPDTRATDEVEKLADYAAAAIPEYWLVDPEQQTVRVYTLNPDLPEYILSGAYTRADSARSVVLPAFEIPLSQLF
jgi:Uma2 family endonuclease